MMRKADVSFEELYNCYKVRFERFAISYIQDRSVAEDIVTDSFVYWWEHRDRVGSKDENPAAYILATIRHKCLNHLRALQVRLRSHNEIRESQSRIVQENIRSLELCDPVHLFAGEVEALVRQSLEELPELTRYIFIDQRLKGKSYRDIAVEYAISERRVETELARDRKHIPNRSPLPKQALRQFELHIRLFAASQSTDGKQPVSAEQTTTRHYTFVVLDQMFGGVLRRHQANPSSIAAHQE